MSHICLTPLLIILLLSHSISAFTLITFDVDGTLVAGSGKKADASAHSRAFGVAVGQILAEDGQPTLPVAQVLPRRDYHGSTDGLILLRLAKATGLMKEEVSEERLHDMFQAMYEYITTLDDAEIADGIGILPGVIDTLTVLATMKDRVACGLVTGNVEGIARRKMKAVGIWDTDALTPASSQQKEWFGTEKFAFLGGFGSDYCSRNIDDAARNHLDRGEQIAIAVNRCRSLYPDKELTRVVHVGDAPSDVLAAKSLSERYATDESICVGCVGVATGSYGADELQELVGESVPGVWEPVILEEGLACESALFLEACGL